MKTAQHLYQRLTIIYMGHLLVVISCLKKNFQKELTSEWYHTNRVMYIGLVGNTESIPVSQNSPSNPGWQMQLTTCFGDWVVIWLWVSLVDWVSDWLVDWWYDGVVNGIVNGMSVPLADGNVDWLINGISVPLAVRFDISDQSQRSVWLEHTTQGSSVI